MALRRATGVSGRFAVLLLLAGFGAGGCSWLPDSANPTTWSWRSLNPVNWFESEPAKQQPVKTAAKPTLSDKPDGKPFPSVNDTPAKPQPSPALDREKLAQGLQADRSNAR